MSNAINFDLEKILKWNKLHVFMMFVASCSCFVSQNLLALSIVAFSSFVIYVYNFRNSLNRYSPFAGYANLVTLIRLFALIVTSIFWLQWSNLFLFFILLTSILSDVLDGFLARRLNLSSDFGLYLDMETDAFLVSIMSFILWEGFGFHWIVLIAGFMRYFYAVVVLFINRGSKKEPKRFYASFIAGLFYIALLLPFLYQSEIISYLLYLVCTLIILSFMRSFLFQLSED